MELRDAAIGLFNFYRKTVDDGYKVILEIFIEGAFTESEMDTLNKILEATTTEEAIHDSRYQTAQNAFAVANGILLLENELNQQFNK
ncbi:MAG: hypothetical protein GC205_07220 [Bacteroidetes bacterium]|nr:hypothetical protein [Bacteroidota bacterium]